MSNDLGNQNNEIRRQTSEALEAVEALKKKQESDRTNKKTLLIIMCIMNLTFRYSP
jgi:hypothetical protein